MQRIYYLVFDSKDGAEQLFPQNVNECTKVQFSASSLAYCHVFSRKSVFRGFVVTAHTTMSLLAQVSLVTTTFPSL